MVALTLQRGGMEGFDLQDIYDVIMHNFNWFKPGFELRDNMPGSGNKRSFIANKGYVCARSCPTIFATP